MNPLFEEQIDDVEEEILITRTIQEFENLKTKGKSFRIASSPLWFKDACSTRVDSPHDIFQAMNGISIYLIIPRLYLFYSITCFLKSVWVKICNISQLKSVIIILSSIHKEGEYRVSSLTTPNKELLL